MVDDWELLQKYVDEGSREALDTLVRRHMSMVFAVARRAVGDASLAEDVTQAVFLILMRRAHSMTRKVVLSGWLFKVVRYVAADIRKSRARRERHEIQAGGMKETAAGVDVVAGEQLLPLLYDAIASLPTVDRDAVVMVYLQGMSHGEVAAVQRISENAARQRLFRAMAKLRTRLQRRGVPVSEWLLGSVLSATANQPVPPTFVERINSCLWSGDAQGRAALIAGKTLRSMFMCKAKIAAVVTLCVLVVIVGGGLFQHLRAEQTAKQGPPISPSHEAANSPTSQLAVPPAHGPASTPKGTVSAAFAAACAGDNAGLVGCFDQPSAADTKLLEEAGHAMNAVAEVKTAVAEKFGQQQGEAMFHALGPGVGEMDVSQSTEVIDGQTATVDLHAGPGKIPLVKTGELWKISTDVLRSLNRDFIAAEERQVPSIRAFAADIKAGKYATMRDLQSAIDKVMTVMNSGPAN